MLQLLVEHFRYIAAVLHRVRLLKEQTSIEYENVL